MFYSHFYIEICFLMTYNNYNRKISLFGKILSGGMYNEGYYIGSNGSRYGKQIWRS